MRFTALDGLRGWAALSVLVFHFGWETFGNIFPAARSYPATLLGSDILAISIFFVLSGYVLTRHRWDANVGPLVPTLAARYVRLALPVAAATLLTLGIVILGWDANTEAAPLVESPWLGKFLTLTPSLTDAAWFAAIGAFLAKIDGGYGPFLWTMIFELWGSVAVLVMSQFRVRLWQPLLLVVASVVLLRVYSIASPMFLGALLALIDVKRPSLLRSVVPWPLVVLAALLLAGWIKLIEGPQAITATCAVAIVAVARADNGFSRFLDSPISQWLGYMSFPMYLAQFAILVTLASHLIIVTAATGVLNAWTAAGIAILSVLATVAAAYAFVPVEKVTRRLMRMLKPRRVVAAAQLS